MKITMSTVKFSGRGHIDCRKCSHRTVFPDGAWVLVFDYGETQIVRSVRSLATLHRCGQEHFWQCAVCGDIPEQADQIGMIQARRRNRRFNMRCVCGGEFVQHRVPEVPDLEEEIETRISPF